MVETLRARAVVEGGVGMGVMELEMLGVFGGLGGKRSAARKETAIMEFRVVRGNWPIPASREPVRKARGEGMWIVGCQRENSGVGSSWVVVVVVMLSTVKVRMPMRRMMRA